MHYGKFQAAENKRISWRANAKRATGWSGRALERSEGWDDQP